MRENEFERYLVARDLAEKTITMAIYALKRVERAYGVNLDAEFDRDKLSSILASFTYSRDDERSGSGNPSKMAMDAGRLYKQLAWYRHKLRLYQAFRGGAPTGEDAIEQDSQDDEEVGRTFSLERDMQAALRANIGQLEVGLTIVDNGAEARVDAGLIDILAKDKGGTWVVVELKANVAQPAALTQLLAYMTCISSDRGGQVRGILVASDFDRKIRLAVRALPNILLKEYRFHFEFS
jgi:endonuclease